MKKIFEKNDKKGARVFFSLVLCMLIFSISAVTFYENTMEKQAQSQTHTTIKQVEVKKTDVVKTTTIPQTTTTAPKTNPPTTTKSTVAQFFVMPVGGVITKNFSNEKLQFDETYNDWRVHLALDIAAEKGTEIHSAGDGIVNDIYEDDLLGQVVIIDHGNGIIAHYCGVLSPKIEKGQIVAAGDVIGGVGKVPSESVEQFHLHFAVQKDGQWVDPVKTLDIGIE